MFPHGKWPRGHAASVSLLASSPEDTREKDGDNHQHSQCAPTHQPLSKLSVGRPTAVLRWRLPALTGEPLMSDSW